MRRIVIAGGGNIGLRLAQRLEDAHQVKMIERDPSAHAAHLRAAAQHHRADRRLRRRGAAARGEHRQTDVFIALTNDDEANILSAMLAKRLGARA